MRAVNWTVFFQDEFDSEFQALAKGLQDELLAHALLLSQFGPSLGRPAVDTLKGSKHANMKELRFGWQAEVWRVAFAFDPNRQAVLLVAGDKGGADQKRYYRRLIGLADARFDRHLASLAAAAARKERRNAKKS
jgi:hypothetical protein